MSTPPDPLARLVRAAAKAPARGIEAPSLATELRALNAWRHALNGVDPLRLAPLWRAGLATALAVAAIAVTASFYAGRQADIESSDPYTGVAEQLTVAINTNWQP